MAVVGVGVAPVGVGFGGATPPKEQDSGVPSGGSGGTPGDRHWRRNAGGVSRDSAPSRECRPGGQAARRGIDIGGGMQAGCPGIPRHPGSAARRMASVSAAKVPQSRRAGAHRAAGGFAADLPRRAGAGRGFRGGGRAYRRQKSVPGRAPRWKQTSEPGYHPHRLRYGTEIPLTRHLLRGAGSPPLPDRHHPPRRSVLLGGRRSASHPRARKTSDLPPGIGISIGPSILTSTKQQNILGEHDPK